MFGNNQHFQDMSDNESDILTNDEGANQQRERRFHRHSQHQIDGMEEFFEHCPHPDEKQRRELGRILGLEPLKVRFWFQNKRTQMKAKEVRRENSELKDENWKLLAENMHFKKALRNSMCSKCARVEMCSDEQHLILENARLKEKISAITAKNVGSTSNFTSQSGSGGLDGEKNGYSGADFIRLMSIPTEADKHFIIELALFAMEEFLLLAHADEPMWIPSDDNISSVNLNEDEYVKTFPRGIGPNLNFKSEASKESGIVTMHHLKLVEMFMDVNKWTSIFAGIVSRAMVVNVLSTGIAGNYNGALQLMIAGFQLPSPIVPTRVVYFVRYCKQFAEGNWAVVDVSLDDLRPDSMSSSRCRRRPSGCVIQNMSNCYSKVTWIEHVEVGDEVANNIYRSLVSSGLAFGAKRWVATLDRQCERLASAIMSINIPVGDAFGGKKIMLKLAERMMNLFCTDVGASNTHSWNTLLGSGPDFVQVMTQKSVNDTGKPPVFVFSAATSFWLPVPPKRLLDFLRDENSRAEWDIMSNRGIVQEMVHIVYGRHLGNRVSLFRVNSNMLILQESCSDSSGSYVVYAPVDIGALNGGDPEFVNLLPSGFAILPDGDNSDGSLLTVAFQILADSPRTAELCLKSVATIKKRIRNSLACGNA